jgi:hypothetical protein
MKPSNSLGQPVHFDSDADADAFLAILLVLYSEVGRVCLLVALNCCISNALAARSTPVDWRMLLRFYPRLSASLLIATQRLSRFWPQENITKSLARFQIALATSSTSTITFAGHSTKSDCSVIESLARDHIVTCLAGLGLLSALDHELSARALTRSVPRDLHLRNLMDEAINGGWNGLKKDGTMEFPAWAERRRHQRIDVNCPAELIGSETMNVSIRNLSLNGVGLQVDHGSELKAGEPIVLRVGESECIHGTVVWWRNGEAAIKYHQPLSRNDPRLKFCLADLDADDATHAKEALTERSRAKLFDVAD